MKSAGWEKTLADRIEAARERPFSWGDHDCATWAFDVVADMTGSPSKADEWRGRYSSALGAARVRKRLGWPKMEDMAAALMGKPLRNILLTQRGDMVFAQEAFGICVGARAAFVGPDGLSLLPLRECRMAWRV